jgi:hypothetical protein
MTRAYPRWPLAGKKKGFRPRLAAAPAGKGAVSLCGAKIHFFFFLLFKYLDTAI